MPIRFHRLARESPDYGWWKLPVAGLMAVFLFFVVGTVLFFVFLAVLALAGATDQLDAMLETVDLGTPVFFGFGMASIAVMLPIILLSVLAVGPRPIGFLTSVEGRMRWRFLGESSVIAFGVLGVTFALTYLYSHEHEPETVSAPDRPDFTMVALVVMILLLTPLQCAAEEYVFRGYLLQLVGSWTRWAWVPVVVSTPLFVAGHAYGLIGLVDVGIFGVLACVVTLRTGGLEAAIAIHVANNVLLMLMEAVGLTAPYEDEGVSWEAALWLLPTLVSSVVMGGLVIWWARRRGVARTREPWPQPPAPVWPQPYGWQPYPYPTPAYAYPYPPQQYAPTYPPQPYAPTYPPQPYGYPYPVPSQPPSGD